MSNQTKHRCVGPAGIVVHFLSDERQAAELLLDDLDQILSINERLWGLPPPASCHVYVAVSGVRFLLESAPWYFKILYGLTFPLWVGRVRRLWREAGGWAVRYRKRPTVALKPPRLLNVTERRVGERIFVKEEDLSKKFRHVACHELTHAVTGHLKLPMWLNEGIAMLTVDHLFGQPTVRPDTLEILGRDVKRVEPLNYRYLATMDDETLVAHYARGYWLTRFLLDTQPDALRLLLSGQMKPQLFYEQIAAARSARREDLWEDFDRVTFEHFQN